MSAVTEEEAREHECCQPQRHMCVASRCMAWRWAVEARELRAVREGEPEPDPAAGWLRAPECDHLMVRGGDLGRAPSRAFARPKPRVRGYCGLAGQVSTSGS